MNCRLMKPLPVRSGRTCMLLWLAMATTTLAQVLPAKPAESPREVFRLYGMDDPYFGKFVEDEPLSDEELQKVWKVLMRVRQFRPLSLERWARRGDQWPLMLQDMVTYRGEAFELRGQAQYVEPIPFDADAKARYGFDQLYRVDLLAQDGTSVAIYTTAIPNGWPRATAMDEPASAYGVLIKLAKFPGDVRRLVFVTPRVAWHPKTLLGKLGMDEGLFDTITNRRPITSDERECFYQLLAAAGRTQPHQLEVEAFAQLKRLAEYLGRNKSAWSGNPKQKALIERQLARAKEQRDYAVPLFNDPGRQFGKLVVFEGDARRCVEVRVDDEDIRARFGIDRYYELAVFTDDSQGNPLIFCVLDLPPDMPLGEDIFARVRIAGFFFKSWAYPQGVGGSNPHGTKQQLAPLILGRDLRRFVIKPDSNIVIGSIVVGGIVLALLAILWAALRAGRRPKLAGEAEAPPPDFSTLRQSEE